MTLIKRASKSTLGESGQSIMMGNYGGTYLPVAVNSSGNMTALMSGSFSGSLVTIATDEYGRMLALALTTGSNHEQWCGMNVTTSGATHVWSNKAYSVVVLNYGPQEINLGFDETASTATFPLRPKFSFGADIQHTYLSVVASTVSSTVYALATW